MTLGAIRRVDKESGSGVPELTVAAVTERDGRFLVVQEWAHGERVLNQPAGHVEPGETLAAAVVRETLEETGWRFVPEAVIGVYLWNRPGAVRPSLRVAFAGRCTTRDPGPVLDWHIISVDWLRPTELRLRSRELRSPMVMQGIADYRAGQLEPIELLSGLTVAELAERARLL